MTMAEDAAPQTETKEPPKLFSEVSFHIVTSDKLSSRLASKLASQLIAEGAKEAIGVSEKFPAINFDLEGVTHIIAEDIHFPGYVEAEAAMIPVVTPKWIDQSIQKGKLAQVRPFTPDPRLFFSGVVVTTAELPEGDKEAIYGGVLALGGQYSSSMTRLVTHVVCLNEDNAKCKAAKQKGFNVKFVAPHWFDDCLKLNRRIDEAPYLHPNPEIERLTHALSMGDPPRVRENFEVFKGKTLFLSPDLQIRHDLREVIKGIIKEGHGSITKVLDEADIYVGQFREGSSYRKASRKGIVVGNLLWLYWIFAHGEWTSPLRRLLHYPVVRGGLKGMENCVISVSNYGGDARLFLENLVTASGAKFTKSMKTENTHLITARSHSEKCVAAKEWNIHMINHLWLEESYAKWEVQSLSNPKYSHFPARTNLTEVVGMTPLDAKALRQFYDEESDDERELEEESDEEMRDVDNQKAAEQLKAVEIPTPQTPASRTMSKAKVPTTNDSTRRISALATPASRKSTIGAFTGGTPSSVMSSGRRAKEAAASKLHESVNDMNLYEKEKKRKGGVLGIGRKRRSSVSDMETSFSDAKATGDEGPPKAKKLKRPKPSIKLLVTGYSGWAAADKEDADRVKIRKRTKSSNVEANPAVKRVLLDLGIQLVDNADHCTHVAAPKLVRTAKFVCALAQAPIIVTTEWFEECIKEGRLVDVEPYLLRDKETEARLGIDLKASLQRAKVNAGKLLKGQTIYVAPNLPPGFDTCKRIVEANGGVCVSFSKGKRISNTNTPQSSKLVLLSSDTPEDQKFWKKFSDMAEGSKAKPFIYSMDWLLDLAMNQKIDWCGKHLVPQTKK